jgi:exodeoxyribonuclease VIII
MSDVLVARVPVVPSLDHPGLYEDVPEDVYFAHDSISRSDLKILSGKTPAHFRFKRDTPDDREDSKSLIIGKATHCLVGEPQHYAKRFAVGPVVNMRTKAGEAQWADFVAMNPGKIILTAADEALAKAMADSVWRKLAACPLTQGVLDAIGNGSAKVEATIIYDDPLTGVRCRVRPDILIFLPGGRILILDLKTTRDAAADKLGRDCGEYGYDLQAAMYPDGVRALFDVMPDFLIVAVDKDAPHLAAIYRPDEDMVWTGRVKYRRGLKTYVECKETDQWPGYGNDVLPLSLPGYHVDPEAKLARKAAQAIAQWKAAGQGEGAQVTVEADTDRRAQARLFVEGDRDLIASLLDKIRA